MAYTVETADSSDRIFEIRTIPDGYNRFSSFVHLNLQSSHSSLKSTPPYHSGKTYRIAASSSEVAEHLRAELERLRKTAIERARQLSIWQKRQKAARNLYESTPFQLFIALLIFISFCTEIVEATMVPKESSGDEKIFKTIDLIFTLLFAAEMFLNLFGKGLRKFVCSGWCLLDLVIVVSGILSVVAGDAELGGIKGIRVIRLFRAFRLSALNAPLFPHSVACAGHTTVSTRVPLLVLALSRTHC